jgi:fructose-bisphosphate aldolase, class II
VHLDHGDEETCYDCIDSGFYSSVMIDASHDPFEQNVAITKRVVDRAHAKGISVEAELGMLGGVEEDIKVEEGNACLTDPAEAERFVKETGCDSLACAIGTSHGAFKFKGKQSLHFDVLEKIKARLPGFPLVMHGSSSVPKEEVDRINAAGGKIAGSMGVDPNEYLPAAKLGVTKVNIDTDGRLVWTRVHREFFRDKPAEFDFRPPGKIFIEEYAKFIASRNQLLGSAGQSSSWACGGSHRSLHDDLGGSGPRFWPLGWAAWRSFPGPRPDYSAKRRADCDEAGSPARTLAQPVSGGCRGGYRLSR